ncbi:hypothetical protein BaRGS_00003069, partial [Batillaria attramentaria]
MCREMTALTGALLGAFLHLWALFDAQYPALMSVFMKKIWRALTGTPLPFRTCSRSPCLGKR